MNYLIVHALRSPVERFTMDVTYARHWKKRQTLNVGHRGMGNSYTKMCVVRENTTNSFSSAGQHVSAGVTVVVGYGGRGLR